MSYWSYVSWLWGGSADGPGGPMRPADAAHDPVLRGRFLDFLDHTEPPATFKASQVAQALSTSELANLGYESWEEAMPAVLELAFEIRAFDDCELFKGGKKIKKDVLPYEIEGSIRIMRKAGESMFE